MSKPAAAGSAGQPARRARPSCARPARRAGGRKHWQASPGRSLPPPPPRTNEQTRLASCLSARRQKSTASHPFLCVRLSAAWNRFAPKRGNDRRFPHCRARQDALPRSKPPARASPAMQGRPQGSTEGGRRRAHQRGIRHGSSREDAHRRGSGSHIGGLAGLRQPRRPLGPRSRRATVAVAAVRAELTEGRLRAHGAGTCFNASRWVLLQGNEGVQMNLIWQGTDSRRPLRLRARRRRTSRDRAELTGGPLGRPGAHGC